MTGPVHTPPGSPKPGEDAQDSETVSEPLPWQGELDTAIADIDSRLSHPRRRASDVRPASTKLSQSEITSELLDEIAWRVSERLRKKGAALPPGPAMAEAISAAVGSTPQAERRAAAAPSRETPPPAAPRPEPRALPHGIAVSIRIRKPLFRFWPFQRRRRRSQAMIMFSDYRT